MAMYIYFLMNIWCCVDSFTCKKDIFLKQKKIYECMHMMLFGKEK
jgi:hypothetical protein